MGLREEQGQAGLVLDRMKREFENLRRRNQELEGGIQIDEEQLEGLRLALEQEKRKSMGVE